MENEMEKQLDKRNTTINNPSWNETKASYSYCRELRKLLFPIELFMCLLMFLVMCSGEIYRQYIFQTLAKSTLTSYSNYSISNETICLNQDYIVNETGSNATFLHLQKKTNIISMYCEVISLGTSATVALFYGPLSDVIGRKPILALCLLGTLLSYIVQVVVIEMNYNVYWLLLSLGIFGLMGGASTVLGVSFAAVADVTNKKWRTVRLGTTESALGFGKASSYLIVFTWINHNGCDFRGPAYLMIGSCLLTFSYLLFMPESLPRNSAKTNSHGFHKLINGLKVFFIPSYVGVTKWWRICVCVLIISVQCLCLVGALQIMNFFLHDKPLEWSYNMIGYYGIISSVSTILGLIVFLPFLVAVFRASNEVICLISIVVAVVANIMTANIKTSWEMFLVSSFQGVQQIAFPALRAILSELIKPDDYGSVLAITASIQMYASVGSTVLFNEVYHPQAVVNGHHFNSGIVFWITAGLWAFTIPFVCLLFKRIPKDNESKHLLSPEKQNYQTVN